MIRGIDHRSESHNLTVRALMRSPHEYQEHIPEADVLVAPDELAGPVFAPADAREGMKAFKEKRRTKFVGR